MTGLALILGLLNLAISLTVLAQPQKKADRAGLLNLNTATVEELQKLPGIGPTTAKAIVRFREKSGPFRCVEDLLAIRGITKKKLEKIRPRVTVKEPPKERKEGRREENADQQIPGPPWRTRDDNPQTFGFVLTPGP